MVPVWLGQPGSLWGIAVVYIAQFIVGAVGPLVMSVPPLLSAQWFGEDERAAATAICSLANNFGSAAGFLLGNFAVQHSEQVTGKWYYSIICPC